jgi:hypothetical protein
LDGTLEADEDAYLVLAENTFVTTDTATLQGVGLVQLGSAIQEVNTEWEKMSGAGTTTVNAGGRMNVDFTDMPEDSNTLALARTILNAPGYALRRNGRPIGPGTLNGRQIP